MEITVITLIVDGSKINTVRMISNKEGQLSVLAKECAHWVDWAVKSQPLIKSEPYLINTQFSSVQRRAVVSFWRKNAHNIV